MADRGSVVDQILEQKMGLQEVRWFGQGYMLIKVKDRSLCKAAEFFLPFIIFISPSYSYPPHPTHPPNYSPLPSPVALPC